MLDVGIGTGGALIKNKELVLAKDIHILGVDIDKDYVKKCRRAIGENGLDEHVNTELISVYDFHKTGFDAAYFSASFMLMPDPEKALSHVCSLLADGGLVYFTQTIEEVRSPLVEKTKPMLKKLTTIDFGQVTYEEDFLETVSRAGLNLVENTRLGGSKARSSKLFVGQPHG